MVKYAASYKVSSGNTAVVSLNKKEILRKNLEKEFNKSSQNLKAPINQKITPIDSGINTGTDPRMP